MIKKLYEQFVELVTQLKNKTFKDQFFVAKFKLTLLYFIIGGVIFLLVGSVVDYYIRVSFYGIALNEIDQPVRYAFSLVQKKLWLGRGIQLSLFAVTAYLLASYAMRPIKRSTELQKRFVSLTSHQLNTPLAVMKTSIEVSLNKKDKIEKERLVQVLEGNLSEVEKLSSIIKFFMLFSKFENRSNSILLSTGFL